MKPVLREIGDRSGLNYFFPMKKSFLNGVLPDVLVFLALLFLAVLRGYNFSGGDMDTYLPFILHEHDPSLFKNELLLGTLGSHPVYIWKAMAVFLGWMSIQRLMQCAFIVQTVVIGSGALLFFRRFFGPGRGWMLFLVMLVVPVTSGGYGVYGLNPYGYFHAGALAFGVVLMAYTLIDGGRWISGGILTGTVFLFHPVTAVYGAAFFGLRAVMEIVRKKNAWRIVTGSFLLIAIAFPSLVPAVHTFMAGGAGRIDPLFLAQRCPVPDEPWIFYLFMGAGPVAPGRRMLSGVISVFPQTPGIRTNAASHDRHRRRPCVGRNRRSL